MASINKKSAPFWVCLIISIGLMIAGFLIPPMGIIDGSVLTAVGILFGFAVVAQIPIIITAAESVKVVKGDMTIEAHQKGKKHDNLA